MSSRLKYLGVVGAFCAALGSTPREADASSINNTKIYSINIVGGTSGFVRLSITGSVSSGRPSCHTNGLFSNYAFELNTEKGKALLSTVQAALLSGRLVSIVGGSSCTTVDGVPLETVQGLTLIGSA